MAVLIGCIMFSLVGTVAIFVFLRRRRNAKYEFIPLKELGASSK
jgi:hypothetical protein